MSERWQIPPEFQPDPNGLAYDVDEVLAGIVGLRARVAPDAFTAETLGTERAGQGAVIRPDGLVVTIGYLITEAEEVWLTTNAGRTVAAHALAYDYETGFGLVQALSRLDAPALVLGDSRRLAPGNPVVIGGAGGRARSLAAQVVARQEFAGYWEYLLDDAIFTAPAHPNWGGTALIGARGDLLGVVVERLDVAEVPDRRERRVGHPELLALEDVRRPAVQVQERREQLGGRDAVLAVVAEARHRARLVVVVPVERVPAHVGEAGLPAPQ